MHVGDHEQPYAEERVLVFEREETVVVGERKKTGFLMW